MENILDEYSKNPLSKELYESIKWWERRRIYYNLIVGVAGIGPFIFLWFSFGTANISIINIPFLLMGLFVYVFFV